MNYKLSTSARKDLRHIWNYTVDIWGEKQAKKYFDLIFDCFEKISSREIIYREITVGDRIFKVVSCEHHRIFFVISKDTVINAILHEKMDFIATLHKRLSKSS